MNDSGTTNEEPTVTEERAAQNADPSPMVPAKREGGVVDASGKKLHEREDRSPLDGLMEG